MVNDDDLCTMHVDEVIDETAKRKATGAVEALKWTIKQHKARNATKQHLNEEQLL